MDRKKIKKIIGLLLLLPVVLLLIFLGLIVFSYYSGDVITKAQYEFLIPLAKYHFHPESDGKDLIHWLSIYRGEAPGHQTMILLGSYALSDPAKFTKLVSSCSDERYPKIMERLVFAIQDSGQSEKFLNIYGYPPSEMKQNVCR